MRGTWITLQRRRLALPALAMLVVTLIALAAPTWAQSGDAEGATKRARNGAGLRAGIWNVRGLADPQGGTASEGMAFEGYFEKGLDRHLAWENTIGFWSRRQSYTESGPLGDTDLRVQSYVVPSVTALKLYPFTGPSGPVQPYVSAGVGFTMGIDRTKFDSTDPIVGSGEDMAFQTGFGFKGGLGMDWRLGPAFGLTVGGLYQWTEFSGDLGGQRLYNGLGASFGLTYRFQY